ncbi:membrane-bound PQQ-dependent dehydrogenase, glucose/quinate/shikimate family [Janthinobacterium sp. SUN120]|uniref:membrane-bound PQQ-dependent dehydrogenase, glucose/quinate/shikimate family n=1 Tax=Janthinobacterium sp. SUN120 TaxID=3004099 RepID=UPI0025B16130|nr:membrane-bound PQQ-dependent dehydrogenase, glucose/quinate/shikimate family [Janthinobacterium sp. SUN120]MDN2714320.1 membrane-bound PQQ-dependent dehydrogenase, glucose/quinate/shikimate family [Janthinobacterium sp. SUN120]
MDTSTKNGATAIPAVSRGKRIALAVFGVFLGCSGLALAAGGIELITLGGSWYYLLAGLGLILAGVLYWRRKPLASGIVAALVLATLLWAVWEIGFAFWPMVPRLAPFLVIGLVAALLHPWLAGRGHSGQSRGFAALFAVVLVAGFASMFQPHGVLEATAQPQQDAVTPVNDGSANWAHYGHGPKGTRFAPYTQIDQQNVGQLQVAWSYRTGELAEGASESQNTPLQIGDTIYTCTPTSKVIALDADTGKERWTFDPKPANTKTWNRCRGVGYYEPAKVTKPFRVEGMQAAGAPAAGACAKRIVQVTMDARLIEIDAQTGKQCEGFGDKGSVDLTVGLGKVKMNVPYYAYTSAPTVARNLIILGGWVFDGRSTDEPSGVVRAYSADTGELVWAWDLGNPAITKLPPEGQTYTRSTPNMWSTPAFDDELGLVYLPTGNEQPDFWGGKRPPLTEKYASAIVALDMATGRERWTYQTVHHDIWDYDVAAQPALYDVPDGKGGKIPALVQLTKRGQIFMLDRRTGKPIADVVEKPVPQEHAAGDWVAKTQPYSTGMPALGAETLTERDMWGATFFDQLACRISFRKLNYKGEFTAPSTQETLIYPGYYGGFNWGGAAVDESNGYMFVNDIRMPQVVRLVPRETVDVAKLTSGHGVGSTYPMDGTPFVIDHKAFNSPLGIPCQSPPWGVFAAIDLKTRTKVWERPAGTVQDAVINGVRARLPIPLGMPTLGGGVSTASGLVFYAGTQDYYLRAMDIATGREVWKARMPVGSQGTPMTYVSPKSGRQYVVVAAGGARQSPDRGDYVIAYALPKTQ